MMRYHSKKRRKAYGGGDAVSLPLKELISIEASTDQVNNFQGAQAIREFVSEILGSTTAAVSADRILHLCPPQRR